VSNTESPRPTDDPTPPPRPPTDKTRRLAPRPRWPGRAGLHPHSPACKSGSGRDGGPGCYAFPAPCPFDTGVLPCDPKTGTRCDGNGMGACSSDWVVGLISDEVIIPKDLEPGHWVLSWRWDCEETAQIWQNCADVEIVKGN
jgi:hypothetical protein